MPELPYAKIIYDPTVNNVVVDTNVVDEIMLLGIIERAKPAIREFFAKKQAEKKIIEVPPGTIIPHG